MAPVLTYVAGRPVYTYGVVVVVAILTALAWAVASMEDRRVCDPWTAIELLSVAAIAALAGAKLGLWWVLPAAPDIATLGRSGGVVQLGLVAGLAVAVAHIRWRRLPVLSTLDAVAPAVALGLAIGRLGCLAAGCCHGSPTSSPLGLVYVEPMAARLTGVPLGVRLHPTQVALALAAALAFVLVRGLAAGRSGPPGTAFGLLLLVDGAARILVDPLRGDPRGELLGQPSGVVLGAVLATVGLALIVAGRARGPDVERA